MIGSYREEYERWLSSPCLTEAEKWEILSIGGDEELMKLRFGLEMDFGTAGLRSTMYMGPGCMNVYTVAQTTQAMAQMILDGGNGHRSVVVAFDSRNNSARFARVAACTLAGNGIHTYLFDELRPTPELSFAVRELGCIAGINITASHNPKEYNGYKAYWEDGAQLPPDQAKAVKDARDKIDVLTGAKQVSLEDGISSGLITMLDSTFDEKYLSAVVGTVVYPRVIADVADTLNIVYTPLHGAGYRLVPQALEKAGFRHVHVVPSQSQPDGDFPTTKKPNPEYAEVFEPGIQLANQVGADLVIATDPDADRVGVMTRTPDGSFAVITGNQMGALLLHYIICARRKAGKLTPDDYAVKSIVSTGMANAIAKAEGVKLYDVLTGFKYIGEVIKVYEESGTKGDFLLGFEESYGYLAGTYARDKDAVSTSLLICEMSAYYSAKGMTLKDALEALYESYGYFHEATVDIYMEGLDGIERRRRVTEALRTTPPTAIGGVEVEEISDFLARESVNLRDGSRTPLELPRADVLIFTLCGGDRVIVRPSGTEPKIKIYFLLSADNKATAETKLEAYLRDAKEFANV